MASGVVSREELNPVTDDLPTRLQAMFHSGEITEFISAQMPAEKLGTGWMEKGLLLKGFTGRLEDKRNQKNLIIPADRFARLTRDLEGVAQPFVGLLILGSQGLATPKLCIAVYDSAEQSSMPMMTVAFWTKDLGFSEITRIITQHVLGHGYSNSKTEPDLDYTEQLRADVSTGDVRSLLSLRVPSENQNITEWIRDSLKQVNGSERVIAAAGDLNSISRIALLLTRWLMSLDVLKSAKNNIAAILFKFNDKTELCLWDSPHGIASFVTLNRTDIENMIDRYVTPMWSGSQDLGVPSAGTPEVVVGIRTKPREEDRTSIVMAPRQIDHTVLSQIRTRLEMLEIRLQALENAPGDKLVATDQSMSIVQTKLAETISRLESVVARLNDLESRLRRVSKSAG